MIQSGGIYRLIEPIQAVASSCRMALMLPQAYGKKNNRCTFAIEMDISFQTFGPTKGGLDFGLALGRCLFSFETSAISYLFWPFFRIVQFCVKSLTIS